ncbi:GUCY2D family protein [Megaselia abdita]
MSTTTTTTTMNMTDDDGYNEQLISSVRDLQIGFGKFLHFFNSEMEKSYQIDFLDYKDPVEFIKQLETGKYTTVIKTINNDNADNDDYTIFHPRVNGLCQFRRELANNLHYNLLFWPCSTMKEPNSFLPSYEAISFAVKSIAQKLNWSEVDIIVGDENWGLPLAISANLHIPYRIHILGAHLNEQELIDEVLPEEFKFNDKLGKAIIVTNQQPADEKLTTRILKLLCRGKIKDTRILFIDILSLSLNPSNFFYGILATVMQNNSHCSHLYANVLVLTVLSDKYRHYLNVVDENNKINQVQNFRSHEMIDVADDGRHQSIRDLMKCTFNITEEKEFCHKLTQLKLRTNDSNCANLTDSVELLEDFCEANALKDFVEYFKLFEFIAELTENKHKYDFIVLDVTTDGVDLSWRPSLILQQNDDIHNIKSFITHSLLLPMDYQHTLEEILWKCGELCWTIITISFGILLIIIVSVSLLTGIAVRNYFLRKRLSKGPNKIVLSASDFVFPVDTRRVDEGIEAMLCCWLQQLQEFGGPEVDKPDLLKGSIASLKNLGLALPAKANLNGSTGVATTTHNNNNSNAGSGTESLAKQTAYFMDMRARYNGDMVQLKEIPLTNTTELKSKAMDLLVLSHGLRHENVNALIGWLSDNNRTAMVFDYCSRGSLQDVLIMDDIKLDWTFRLSLLTDLVRGMRYLHSSPIKCHGALTSRNCVVDARWVLKITDYALPTFYEAQGVTPSHKSAKELLWTAPEILRNSKAFKCGTQAGDVYSFAIIMQEVVVRGEPYCMLSSSPEEIIAKLKKPPPLIRPSVSKGAAPPEAINIMRQCWAEQPEMRPDFVS